jgi:hypothetical protein
MEVEVIEFFLSGPVDFEGPHDVDCRVKCHVFFSKFEVLSHFLALSEEARLVKFIFVSKTMYRLNNYFLLLLLGLRIHCRLFGFLVDVVIDLGLTDNRDSPPCLSAITRRLRLKDRGILRVRLS